MNFPFSPMSMDTSSSGLARFLSGTLGDNSTPKISVTDSIQIDPSILDESIEWIVQLSIYESIEYHGLKRNKSVRSNNVTKWVSLQTKRTCETLKKRFKKCFTSILPSYLQCSSKKQFETIEFIRSGTENYLRLFNVKVPDYLHSKIDVLVKELIDSESIKTSRYQKQNKPVSTRVTSSSFTSFTTAPSMVNDISPVLSPTNIDENNVEESSYFSNRNIFCGGTASSMSNVISPMSSTNMEQDNGVETFSCFSMLNRNISGGSTSSEDVKFLIPVNNNNNNQNKNRNTLDELQSIEISDDEDDFEDILITNTIQTVNQPSDGIMNQPSDDILNQLLSEKLPTLLNDMLPSLVNKRFEQELFKKQSDLNKILQNAFRNQNNTYTCRTCGLEAFQLCIECSSACYCNSEECKTDSSHFCRNGRYMKKNNTY